MAGLVAVLLTSACVGDIGQSDRGNEPVDAAVGVEIGQNGGPDATFSDPFATPATCTSGVFWTRGDHGSDEMNPGRACIACHSTMGEGPRLSLAGTVYPTAHEPALCNGSSGAKVIITGADGRTLTLSPNSAGNFHSESRVALPYQAKVTYQGRERAMVTKQTSGDCNSCHTQMGTNAAPGRILLP